MKPVIKCFTTVGGLFFFVIGLALLVLTIFLFFNSSVFLGNQNMQYIVLGISFSVSTVILGFGAVGVYGICKEKPKLVCVFQIIVIIFMAIFIGLGVAVIFLPNIFFDGGCDNSSNAVIDYANHMYTLSEQVFCQRSCPCSLDTTTAAFKATYNDTEKLVISRYTINLTANSNTTECIRQNLTDPEIALFTVVGQIESFIDCSLWCSDSNKYNLIYRFKDVNSGKPSDFCYSRLQQLYNDYSNIGRYVLFGAGAVMFVMFLCNMYLCCCATERRGANTRSRFMLMNNVEEEDDRPREYRRIEYRI